MQTSVLITCYRRRAFLEFSVASALADGADQVVVVKDWSSPVIDQELRERNVTLVNEDLPVIGAALARGVAACRGETISFLDDDDLIVRGRLPAVRAEFQRDSSLAVLRNGYSEVDVQGNRFTPPEGPRAQPLDRFEFDSDQIDDDILRWIVEYRGYGILSTLTVRRAMLAPLIELLAQVECGIDVAVPTLLMRDHYRHAFIPAPLSVHRVGSSLRAGTSSDDPAAYARTFRRLARAAASPGGRRYAAMNARWAELERLLGRRRLDALQRLRSRRTSSSLRDVAGVFLPSITRRS